MIEIKHGKLGSLLGHLTQTEWFPLSEAISRMTVQPGEGREVELSRLQGDGRVSNSPAQENAVCEQLQVRDNNLGAKKFPIFLSSLPI